MKLSIACFRPIRHGKILFISSFLLACLFQQTIVGQNQAANWIFNGFAMNFAGDSVRILQNNHADYNSWGYSSISDDQGNLLFYTNCFHVWDRDGNLMENGDSLLNPGTVGTSLLHSLIIPAPSNMDRYYIFTLSPFNENESAGLYYAEADMSLNNGKGKIISKRFKLIDSTTNKLTALYDANRSDVWVITHKSYSNSYYSFKVTSEGVSSNPVVSKLGKINSSSFEGQLKGSPDGKMVATSYDTWTMGEGFDLFDFNNETGELTNARIFTLPNRGCHGLEFSPDAKKLYVYQYGSTGESGLYQFDLKANDFNSINSSRKLVLMDEINGLEYMQLAPNGVIYISKGGGGYDGALYFGTINKPNENGTSCDVIELGLDLKGGFGGSVLFPAYIQNYFFKTNFSFSGLCFGDSTEFGISNTNRMDSVLWSFGDNTFSRSLSPKHVYPGAGTYKISLMAHYPEKTDTISKQIVINEIPAISLGIDTTVCSGYKIQLTGKYDSISWPDNSHLKYFTPAITGKVWVRVKNKYNCANSDTVDLLVNKSPEVHIGNDTTICENTELILEAGNQPSGTSLLWSDGSADSSILINREGLYWLKATNELNCSSTDEINIGLKPAPSLNLGSDTTITGFDYLTLDAGFYGYPSLYRWNDNSTYQYKFYSGWQIPPGKDTIHVRVTAPNNCVATDSIIITLVQDFRYMHACEGMDVYFSLGSIQSVDSVVWDFGDNFNGRGLTTLHKYQSTGEYQVKSVIYSQTETDTLEKTIQIVPVPQVDLGDDITIESNSILTLDAGAYDFPVDYRWDNYLNAQYRYIEGKKLVPGIYRYYVTVITRVNQCAASDTISVTLQDFTQSESYDNQEEIRLYPNPVHDIFYIESPGNIQLEATLSDASGKTAGKWDLVKGKNEINISECKAGVYIICFTDGKGYTSVIKIIKL